MVSCSRTSPRLPDSTISLSFEVAGDPDASSTSFSAFWDGAQILGSTQEALGFTKYTFDVVGHAGGGSTSLEFDFGTDGSGQLLDAISVAPTTGPAVETTDGSISFSDAEAGDTHTASFTSQASGYVGTFSLDPVSEVPGNGSVAWHYTVDNADIQFLAQGQTLVQTYAVTILDSNGASTVQDVSVAINGINEAPTAVSETVVTDVGTGGTIDIPGLGSGIERHRSRHHRPRGARQRDGELGRQRQRQSSAMRSSPMTRRSAVRSTTRPPTVSRHRPTPPPTRSPTTRPRRRRLTAAGGDSILIATQGSEQLDRWSAVTMS